MYFDDHTIIYQDGKWVKASDGHISVYSQVLHYGTGVFEGIRSYAIDGQPRMFRSEEHFKRLIYSSNAIGLSFHKTVLELKQITYDLMRRNNMVEAYIRPFVYSDPMMSLSYSEAAHIGICAWPWRKLHGEKLTRLYISSYCRPHPRSCKIEAKVSGHYVNSILAATDARAKGYDDALQLDVDGYVAECSGANFFMEKDGVLYTSPPGHILPGITRDSILQICRRLGIPVKQKRFLPKELFEADGAFMVGTAAEVSGVQSIDDKPFAKKWTSTFGYTLQKEYEKATRQDIKWEEMNQEMDTG
ncbi:MAG: branched-chain-amino-acid transaminase [Saprospiraceae bacterium]|uniref:Branched-chain-amino-acid aminotransferase n=1 Tax=Candidatus Opimibacter skivensis TaxID=2982028 RepID=A0A9D7SVB1_9BACT|nr:branched-chain-amino-acid transaminase [Candidatus Opimibacter skivensis]